MVATTGTGLASRYKGRAHVRVWFVTKGLGLGNPALTHLPPRLLTGTFIVTAGKLVVGGSAATA
jgi:hypothetical protein